MYRFVPGIVVCAFVLLGIVPARADVGKESLVEQVGKSIERGIGFLRERENGTGDWEADRAVVQFPGGLTSLATLALLNAGVKPDDPIMERALTYLRQLPLGPESKTYVVSLQTMAFAEAGCNEDKERIQKNVDWLIRTMLRADGKCMGWTYGESHRGPADNSNTQYALLGLHAGHEAGARVDREVWQSIQDYYIRTQMPDGGWVYNRGFPGSQSTLTMTTAGLCGLIISGMELNAGREELRPDGTAANCGRYTENEPVARALRYIGSRFRIDVGGNVFYNLYGIERAGRLSGQRFLGDRDWYRGGCEYLVRSQKEDGSWHEPTQYDDWPVVSTSFALLFLSKGRTPVLISKLLHGPGDDWNNDRHDARNLVAYAGKELFRNKTMAWQVFDARRVEVKNDDDLLALVADMMQSPILYFNGHESPRFTGVELKLLKQYVEQGGFILAEACCGREEFNQGFRELMRELFPDTPLKKLGPDHPIWRAHTVIPPNSFKLEGIEYGCKTVVVYSPEDLSCLWEANQYDKGPGGAAFRLGGNIIAYATGMEPPKPRLTQAEVVKGETEGKPIPRGYLRVAQLRHEGDWQPAPYAMRNLLEHLRREAGINVDLRTKPMQPADPDLMDFRFMYMHGRGNFVVSPEGIKNLRMNLETGGLLFADACCGRKPFDASFRAMVAQLFPDKKLEPIPVSDDLYNKDLNGTAITSVRCRTELPGSGGQAGEFRDVAPYLEGVKVGNRWVVIYSKYDIGCALEKHQSTDCLGHDHGSALRLGSAAVLYALKR
jgi:hypothetical protein